MNSGQGFDKNHRADLEACAQILVTVFNMSSDPLAKKWIEGWLKPEIERIIDSENKKRPTEIPHLSLVTRDALPEDEAIAYLNFWSMACYGEIGYMEKFIEQRKLLAI